MALKLILFLAILYLAVCVPEPDPEPDIQIDLQQLVNDENAPNEIELRDAMEKMMQEILMRLKIQETLLINVKSELEQMKGTQELLLSNVNMMNGTLELQATTPPIAETTVISTTELPGIATTPPIAETTVVSTTELPECPGDMFLFGPSNGRQCFKYYGDSRRTWTAADQKCRAENLVLAEPKEPTSLRAYIVANYNPNDGTHLGARGDGSSQRWVRSGAALSNTSPLWWPGAPGSYVNTAHNLLLGTTQGNLDAYPTKPYFANQGTYARYTLCELVMN